jgi:3D (Asp-Asp-Asp) domain-containing protein
MTRLPVISIALAVAALTIFAPLGRGVAWAQSELAVGASALVSDTDGGGLRLRSGPGLSQSVQATLADGVRVQVLEGPQTADGHSWYRVSAPTGSGWASARYLSAAGGRATLASAGTPSGRTLQMRLVAYNVPASSSPRTTTGTTPRWGTVAVDPQVIPLGTRLLIEGFEGTIFVAEDTGGAVRGNLLDIWFDDGTAAGRFGTQTRAVTVLER